MKNITVIGAGTMGNGITHAFAQNGFSVIMVDISQDSLNSAMKTIEKNLDRMLSKEKISLEDKKDTLKNISTSTSLENSVLDCDLVVEAATENVNLKLKIFNDLDRLCPKKTILASNTSSISISEIAKQTNREDKVIGMHFMNPVPIMKLVEVIKGKSTSKDVTNIVMELSKELGKIPVEVNDAPGFVANRILMPMINEAILTLEENVSGVEEIDTVMILGMSHPMGPLHLADFIGLDVCLSILDVMYKGFNNEKYIASKLLSKMVTDGNLGIKSGKGFYDYSEGPRNKKVSSEFIR
ncbi:MAG: 3-hydroxyacyl-CoA dehydrogenase family protein [Flavobacteriales bacterium]|jgi:3-hydroxybutyryl-CoA dehydrogenase|nr:3-hydroxyacyl-CoA dehydrogenase NAD-binding domain-containing protein [Flavobacteriales bacterium]|tara:strand:+ start:12908 stop:13798 length:891 start_codon:yes stop_codon:yes gene_type:complete